MKAPITLLAKSEANEHVLNYKTSLNIFKISERYYLTFGNTLTLKISTPFPFKIKITILTIGIRGDV